MMTTKNLLCTATGIAGAAVSSALGGWNAAITTMFILIVLDYITGLLVASVFTNSTKTKSGGLSSKICLRGIIKKVGMLFIVIAAHRIDLVLGVNYIRDAVVIAFITNEMISLIENAGLMGIPIPAVITRAIDILKESEQNEDKQKTDSV